MEKFIEIVEYETGNVVKRIKVTGYHESKIDRIERGMNININTNRFFTGIIESKIDLPLINPS